MKVIGGFYELLLPEESFSYHQDAVALSNGRACIRLMIENSDIKKCYLPNYTCDAVFHPFDLEQVPYELYNIDENMDPLSFPELAEGEYFYYINYFGIKNSTVEKLYAIYGDRLIIDNTHDFFKKRQDGCWSFTSARKYFGVSDGAFLYSPKNIDVHFERFHNFSLNHSVERLKGNQGQAFREYQEYEKGLNSDINRISLLSEKMLSLVNVQKVAKSRKENFRILHEMLGGINKFKLDKIDDDDTPFAYPFIPAGRLSKPSLYDDNIFIPSLWVDPLKRSETNKYERGFAETLMPLPIDERYRKEDMEFMAGRIMDIMERNV